MRKRWLKILLKVLLLLFVLFFVFLLFERWRGQISLAHYKRELIAKGEKLTPQDLTASIPDGENGAPEALQAARELQEGKVLPKHYPPKMQLTPSGHAVIGFRENEWIEEKTTNRWDSLAADLKTNEATLARIRVALEKPAFNNQLDYSLGFKMPITNLATAKSLTYWFGGGSELALHEGNNRQALEYLIPHIQLPRLMQLDRILISELVRIAIGSNAKNATWEALQADGWTDEDLTKLQQAWESQDFINAMARGFEGERVYDDVPYELIRKSNKDAIQALYGLEEYFSIDDSERPKWERGLRKLPYGDVMADVLKKQIYCRVWRFAWSYQDQRHSVEQMQSLLEITRAAAAEKSFTKVQSAIAQFDEASNKKNFYDNLRYPTPYSIFTLSRAVNKAMRAETDRSITICAIALKRYSLRNGRFPATLGSLVPGFIQSVPIDYMDGQPMKYHLNADGSFVLYSVGEDGKDNGGDATLLPDKTSSRNLWDRKDFIWPIPAASEEIEAWRKESAKN